MTTAYGTNQEFESWLLGLGLSLPSEAPSNDVLRALGSAYVDAAYEYKLSCSKRTDPNQSLAWPRKGHGGVADNIIPQAWVLASYRAAYLNAINPGWSTGTVNAARITKREKVDVIEREFFAAGEAGGTLAMPGMPVDGMIEGLVYGWLCSDGRRADSLFRVI